MVCARASQVHFQMLPEPKAFYDNPDIVRAFEFMKRAFGVCLQCKSQP